MSLCNDADLNYRTATNKQFLVELTLAKICQSLSPSPNKGSDGEGRLRKIDAADTKAPLVSAPAATAPTKPSAPAATHKATSPQATGLHHKPRRKLRLHRSPTYRRHAQRHTCLHRA